MKNKSTTKWLINNSKSQSGNMVILILANAIFSILTVVFAYVIKLVVDGAEKGDKNLFLTGAMAVVAVIVVQFLLRLLINGITEHIKAKLDIAYRTSLFNEIQKKKHSDISAYHSGELLNRLTADVSVISEGVSSIVPTIVASTVRLISAVVMLLFIDWVFAVAFVSCGVIVFFVTTLLRGKLKSLHKKVQQTDGKTRSFMQECIENGLVIKSFAVADKTSSIADELQKENFKFKMKRRNYSVLGHSLFNLVFSAGYVFALILGGYRLLSGAGWFGFGDLTAVLQLVNSVQVPFATLSSIMPKLFATTASVERITEIENLQDEKQTLKIDVQEFVEKFNGISIEKVHFTYDRESVYENANLYIKKGSSVAVVGASGVGKSTLIKLLLGVYPLDEGQIYLDTKDGKIPVDASTRSLFCYVPQGNMLFSGTVKDNVTFIKTDAKKSEIERALKISCADQFVKELPNGLDTVVGENGLGLSEGQVQRLAIARAVLTKAPVMLLDEATCSLDAQTEKQVIDNLLGLKDTTLILVSHRNSASESCDKTVSVENKKLSYQ
ncbi:MAG: ABC transporter ATP-binding protein [Clostridia bacterium]|nr:ABC transporter ATP-binding protein [Clostridia bacterium]